MPEFLSTLTLGSCFSDIRPQSAKEPVREVPDVPHDPEILPDLPPEPGPDLSPEIPVDPVPEILPGGIEPEINPSPEL